MCSTKMLTKFRQYMPAKPHKYGMKLFVLCDSNGFSYRFEVYKGAGDNKVIPKTPDLGSKANVVIRLSSTIPDFKNHILYFDNFYTSLPLFVYLRSRGIYALGTVRSNRIPKCKLTKEVELKDKERGYSEEFVGRAFGVDISCVQWKDTKYVRLVSTYAGIKPFKTLNSNSQPLKICPYDRKNKSYVDVDCPNIIKEYNRHGRYHIRVKTKKWTLRLFYHLIDMSIVNSYLFQRIHGINCKDIYHKKLPNFRIEVADVLCRYEETNAKRAVGRPHSLSPQVQKLKKSYDPPDDVRFDGVGHMPDVLSRSGKKVCKLPGCKSETQMYCTKCKLNMCLSNNNKCFQIYHQNNKKN